MNAKQVSKNQPSMKGQLSAMPEAVILLVLVALIAAVGLLVLNAFLLNPNVSLCTNSGTWNGIGCSNGGTNTLIQSATYNAVGQGITGVSTVTSFLSLIALVIVASIIIGLVVFAFARGAGGGSERF